MVRKALLVFCLLITHFVLFAQTNPLELTSRRDFLDTKVLKSGLLLKPYEVKKLFLDSRSNASYTKYNFSKYLLYTGVPCVAGGVYLSYDAIRGTRMSVVENGVELVYYKRPIFQLMGGIALFTAGICLIEYNNEFKATAVTLHNKNLKSTKPVNVKVGVLPSGNVGLYASF